MATTTFDKPVGTEIKTINDKIADLTPSGLRNGNIDTYFDYDVCWIQSASSSGTQPGFNYYTLEIIPNGYGQIVQRATHIVTGATATRIYANSSWGSWRKDVGTDITVTSFTPVWGTGTYTGGFTDLYAYYSRSGNVVTVTLTFKMGATADSSHGYINLTNMPYTANMPTNGVFRVSNNAKFGTCYFTNGSYTMTLYFLLGDGTFAQSGQSCVASISYITGQ